jgi:hypothetical protein
MKKTVLSILLLFVVCMTHAQSPNHQNAQLIEFSVQYIPTKPLGNGHPKSPDETPTVYIDDYTLYFEANHPEYVLNIKDEDGDVVYTTVVYSAQTQAVLPSTLSGNYVIELAVDNLLYTGWIEL